VTFAKKRTKRTCLVAESIKRMYMSCSCRKPATHACNVILLRCRSDTDRRKIRFITQDRERSWGLIFESQTERFATKPSATGAFETLVHGKADTQHAVNMVDICARFSTWS